MIQDVKSSRPTSILVVRASVDDDGRFLARITMINDLPKGPAVSRVVATAEEVVDVTQAWLGDLCR